MSTEPDPATLASVLHEFVTATKEHQRQQHERHDLDELNKRGGEAKRRHRVTGPTNRNPDKPADDHGSEYRRAQDHTGAGKGPSMP